VQSQKGKKIDLNVDYPCPCRRRGRLVPITLTDAFGCDRCQQLFVVENNGYVLEQLSTSYPYKRAWRWVGNRWVVAQTRFGQSYLPVALGIILVLLIVWLPLALRSPNNANILVWVMVAVVLAVLPAMMVWLTYRR
jgi:hypothetical protein